MSDRVRRMEGWKHVGTKEIPGWGTAILRERASGASSFAEFPKWASAFVEGFEDEVEKIGERLSEEDQIRRDLNRPFPGRPYAIEKIPGVKYKPDTMEKAKAFLREPGLFAMRPGRIRVQEAPTERAKTAARSMPSFLDQNRPAGVKKVYKGLSKPKVVEDLKRRYGDRWEEVKARIAARQGKKGKQPVGPPYKPKNF